MARLKGITRNLNAFLDMLSVAEGTSTSPATKDEGYDVIVTGIDKQPEIFSDYRWHPFSLSRKSKTINFKGLTSNASGRYQFMLKDYRHYRDLLKLPDFGPESQDRWAIQLIKERKALVLIENGRFVEAVMAVRNLWASLPGAGYGQPEHSMDKLRAVYLNKGGTIWGLNLSSGPSSQPLPVSLDFTNTEPQKLETKPMQLIELHEPLRMRDEILSLIKKLLRRK